MIGHAVLRVVVGADLLAASAAAHLGTARRVDGILLLLALDLIEAGTEYGHRAQLVLRQGALALAGHHHIGGRIHNPHRRVVLLHMLAARPGCAVGGDLQILMIDVDLHVIDLRQHRHGDRRGVDAPAGFGDGDTLHTMDAALVLEVRIGALALHHEGHLFVAADPGAILADHLDLPAALAFGVARVEAEKLRREEAGLVAAGAGANFHNYVFLIAGILGDQQLLEVLLQLFLQVLQARNLLLRHLLEFGVLFLRQHLVGHLQFVQHLAIPAVGLDRLFKIGALLSIGSNLFVILRDLWIGHQLRQLDESILQGAQAR